MGKRNLVFCDLCKLESEEDELFSLNIKKPGKGRAHSYDICGKCAEYLQTQLVSNTVPSEAVAKNKPRRIEDLDIDENEELINSKQGQELNIDIPERPIKIINANANKDTCSHLNKTRDTLVKQGGKRTFVRTCRDCGTTLPSLTVKERETIKE